MTKCRQKNKPWGRLTNEGDKPFEAFRDFLKLEPPRRIEDLAKLVKKAPNTLYKYASNFRWRERAMAYDAWLQSAEDRVFYQNREELAKEHLKVIRKARDVADEAITALLEAMRNADEKLSPRDALSFLEKAVTLERLVAGEATDRVETFDLSKLSGDEAEALLSMIEKM